MKVTVFSDVVCPWCYLGTVRFERAAAAVTLSTGVDIDVTLRAYQLDPDATSEGKPLLDSLTRKFGGRDAVDAMVARVRTVARSDGLEFDFESAVAANTYDAHRLLTWAGEYADAGMQRDLAHELWKAHFAEGADVADHDTLAARAALVGLDPDRVDEVLASGVAGDEVKLQRDAAHELGIRSVPTFVIDNRWMITGAQSQHAMEQALRELVAAES